MSNVAHRILNGSITGWLAETRGELMNAVNDMHAINRGSALYGTLVQCSNFLIQQLVTFGARAYSYEVVILSDGNGDDYLSFKKDLDSFLTYIKDTTAVRGFCGWCISLSYLRSVSTSYCKSLALKKSAALLPTY